MTPESHNLPLKRAEKGVWISIFSYIAIACLKTGVGFIFNSRALIADGLNNFTDVVSSVTVLLGLKIAQRPSDENHPYGHWKFETIASLITSFIMAFIGLQLLTNVIKSILSGDHPGRFNLLTISVAFLSAIALFLVYLHNSKLAKSVNSKGLMAASKDNLNDSLTSITTAIALIAANYGFGWIDSAMALLVSLIILKTAVAIFREAVFELSDGFDQDDLDQYITLIMNHDGVSHVDSIKARYYGANIYVDTTISVNPSLTVKESHKITEDIEDELKARYHVAFIDIHVEPDDIPDANRSASATASLNEHHDQHSKK
ncbi:cation diffusion facilitator family transporter [Bavariicoccus seileri]|uniref:cation diffusion facilitator family transporter n=1 Tax=Bavariicoccus seileri TaxID=549685 RepID=UPI0003B3E733|nr:cation diffusion facilitator family transporter [Bavariicoccus seileri]